MDGNRGGTPVLSEISIPVEDYDNEDTDKLLHFEKSSIRGYVRSYNKPNYWRQNMYAVLTPLFACGLPVHVLASRASQDKRPRNEDVYPFDWKTWYRFRFQTRLSTWMSIFLWPAWLLSMGYLVYLIVHLLVYWVYWGKLTMQNLFDLGNIMIVGPFVAMSCYCWFYGHAVAPILDSLLEPLAVPHVPQKSETTSSIVDKTSTESVYNYQDLQECIQENSNLQVNTITIRTEMDLQDFRFYTVRQYILWTVTHLFHTLISLHRAKIEKWSTESIYRHWINYFCIIFFTLVIIVYSNCCGIILSKFQRFNGYLRRLTGSGDKMRMIHVHYIKNAFTRIAEDIVHVNFIFRRWLLFAWLAMYYTVAANVIEIVIFMIARIIWGFEHWFEGLGISTRSLSGIIDWDVALSEDSVRIFIGMIAETFLYTYLTLCVMYDAVHVNDEARYLHVRVNNLASDLASGDHHLTQVPMQVDGVKMWWLKQNFINEDVYRAFFLLKQYLHSRMETHAGKHRALLNVFGFSYFKPAMANRLSGYNQNN